MPVKKPDYSYTEVKDASGKLKEVIFMPSTLEIIDTALFEYIDNELDIHTKTNKGWKKSPVIWVSAERSFQIKNDKKLRDSNGNLILPLVTVERTSVTKDPAFKGVFQAHQPQGKGLKRTVVAAARRINQEKTSNFANADAKRLSGDITRTDGIGLNQSNSRKENKKIVTQTIMMPLPNYITIMYSVVLKAEYLQQINDMVQPFITKTGNINNFFIKKDGHKFEGFMQNDFSQNNNVSNLGEEERTYETKLDIKILGYLMGEGPNDERPKLSIEENFVEVKIPRERVIAGDIRDFVDASGKFVNYRE
tara:strand:- start:352 stop:1272 length:921 start_codon:yes stop_codon:yes gene_type:complete